MSKRETIQQEALSVALLNQRAGLAVSMGVGKTYIGLQYLNEHYKQDRDPRFLVVAPKLSIFKSWQDDAVKFKLEHLLPRIAFTTYLSLNKQDLNYDVIILDECHNLLTHHGDYLISHYGKILGLTGTPPKHSGTEKDIMVSTYCPIKYTYITDDAVDDAILNDYLIFVHKLKLSDRPTIKVAKKSGGHFYQSEQKSYNYWSQRIAEARPGKAKQIASIMRMKAMMEFPSKEHFTAKLLSKIQEKCLVFANTQAQADRICSRSYHSKNPDSEQNLELFKQGKIQEMSCVLQLSEGVTVPDLKTSVILHAYGNERKFMQRFGRCLRLSPDETASIHVLCYKDTVDETWVANALEDLDRDKIRYVDHTLVLNAL